MVDTLFSGAARQRRSEQDIHLPRSAYFWLALAAATLGLACSAITAKFFVLGLQRVESDGMAREVLILAGVLMVVVELAAFGLAALLPRERLKALRTRLIVMGIALVAFEIATIYTVQVTLVRGGDAVHQSASSRIAHLEASIAQSRKTAEALVANGLRGSESPYPASRAAGAQALKDATKIEQRTTEMAAELVRLKAEQAPTLVTVLGEQGMIWYAVTRSVLVTGMGLVMFAAAGAMLRAGRAVKPALHASGANAELSQKVEVAGKATTQTPEAPAVYAQARRWSTAGVVPVAATASAAFASPMHLPVVPSVPASSYSAPVARVHAPEDLAPKPKVEPPVEPGSKATSEPVAMTVAQPVKPTSELTDSRYLRLRDAVACGQLKPSVRALKAAQGGGTDTVSAYLQQMLSEGILDRQGQGYVLTEHQVEATQLELLAA